MIIIAKCESVAEFYADIADDVTCNQCIVCRCYVCFVTLPPAAGYYWKTGIVFGARHAVGLSVCPSVPQNSRFRRTSSKD